MTAALTHGTPIPGALGGALVDGNGKVLREPGVERASRERMWSMVDAAGPVARRLPPAMPIGDLPAGIHHTAWGEVATRFADGPRRAELTRQLGSTLGLLHLVGIEQVVVGGSYVGTKVRPGDVDVALVPRRDGDLRSPRVLQRAVARIAPDVHLYDASTVIRNAGELPGTTPGENFLDFFLHDRRGVARGALLLQPGAPSRIPGGISSAITGFGRLISR